VLARLELLRALPDVETHLVFATSRTTIGLETPYSAREVAKLFDVYHGTGNQAAASDTVGTEFAGTSSRMPCSWATSVASSTVYLWST